MKRIPIKTPGTTLVVPAVLALIMVGLSAFAYPTLVGNERDRDETNATGSDPASDDMLLNSNGNGADTEDAEDDPNDSSGMDPGIERAGQGDTLCIPFRLHATPVDGDGDGIADDVIIYASRMDFFPLGGVMIYIDGIYVGATSFEGWLFATDFSTGYHRVRGLYHCSEAYTGFRVGGVVEPVWGSLEGAVFGEDPSGPTHTPVAGALVEIFSPRPDRAEIDGGDDTDLNDIPRMETDLDDLILEDVSQEPDHVRYYASTTTDRHGGFSFQKVPTGRYIIRVTAPGYHPHSGGTVIRSGETTVERITLRPVLPGSLAGAVLKWNPDGTTAEPIPGALVELFGRTAFTEPVVGPVQDGLPRPTVLPTPVYYERRITDENGRFLFRSVPEGTYLMRVSAAGVHTHEERVTIRAGEQTSVRIVMKPILPGRLVGTVSGSDPFLPVIYPIPGAKVEIFTSHARPSALSADTLTGPGGDRADARTDTDGWTTVPYYDVTYTDENGAFAFEKVPAGTYVLRVTARGWFEHRERVTVREGETTEVNVLLKPVTHGRLEGSVLADDPNQPHIRPVPGALVEIVSFWPYPVTAEAEALAGTDPEAEADTCGLWTPFDGVGICHGASLTDDILMSDSTELVRYYARTRTDEHGQFSFDRVPAGTYILRVTCDGFEPYRGRVTIRPDETTTVRIWLTPVRTGILEGAVYRDDPNQPRILPVAGALVEIFTPYAIPYPDETVLWTIDTGPGEPEGDADTGLATPVRYYDRTITGEHGEFRFPEVPDGTYMMRVTADGYHGHREVVRVRAGEITRVRVMLAPILPGRLEGFVYGEEWVGGPIHPVGNALVVLWNPDVILWTRTDRSGGFSFEDVPQGEYVLYVYADEYFPHKEPVRIAEGQTTHIRVILTPVMEQGSIRGTLYGEEFPSGRLVPILGATIRLVNHGGSFDATTNEHGEFQIENVPEGDYVLYVRAGGWQPHREKVTIRGGEVTYTRIILRPIPTYGALTGVVRERGGDFLPGPAKVTLAGAWYMETAITDRSGNFAFDKVPAGVYRLHVTAENYEETTLDVEILPDQTVEVKIELEPMG